jgi:putative membrane protein
MEQTPKGQGSIADFLAAERTFLAWIRTGLALMALGFVLARFGIFLQEFNTMRPDVPTASYGYSLWFGTLLILVGVAVSVFSMARYLRLVAMISRGERTFDKPSALAVGIAIFLALLGLAMSYYLISSRHVSLDRSQNTQTLEVLHVRDLAHALGKWHRPVSQPAFSSGNGRQVGRHVESQEREAICDRRS